MQKTKDEVIESSENRLLIREIETLKSKLQNIEEAKLNTVIVIDETIEDEAQIDA